ncbi:MAG: pilin [Patescibacteria group bacterium]
MNLKTMKRALLASLAGFCPAVTLAQGLSGIQPFQGTAQSNLPTAVTNIINILLILAALVAGIFLIIGGVQYITSGSDESGQEKAKNRILYAVIGLIFIGLAAAIVNFVVGAIGQA